MHINFRWAYIMGLTAAAAFNLSEQTILDALLPPVMLLLLCWVIAFIMHAASLIMEGLILRKIACYRFAACASMSCMILLAVKYIWLMLEFGSSEHLSSYLFTFAAMAVLAFIFHKLDTHLLNSIDDA